MPTALARRQTTDPEEFWKTKKVPRAYVKMFIFVHRYNMDHGHGPTWMTIAKEMGWFALPREEWRKKVQRGRRFGLKFRPGVQGSTCVRKNILPYVKERAGL
jgi:hypothetical protein